MHIPNLKLPMMQGLQQKKAMQAAAQGSSQGVQQPTFSGNLLSPKVGGDHSKVANRLNLIG